MIGRAWTLAVSSLLAFGRLSPAQTPGNPSELSTHDAATTFSTRVNLVMVPVVVRDRQGHAIGNLKQEDFQLFDKGKPQVITRFSIEKAGDKASVSIAPAQELDENGVAKSTTNSSLTIPTRFLAYIFDDAHLEFGDLAQARSAAYQHLQESLQPTDRVAILTTSGQSNLDFTDDIAKIREALDRIQPRSRVVTGFDCPDLSYYVADAIQNRNDPQAFNTAVQDTYICANLDPTSQSDQATAQQMARSAAARMLAAGEMDTKLVLSVLNDIIRRMSVSPGQRTIVLVSPGFFLSTVFRTEEADLMDRAIRSNVTINAVDARGLYSFVPGGDASQGRINSTTIVQKDMYRRESELAGSDTLAELADGTGGAFFHNSNDLVQGFRRVDAAPEFLYLLGFSPQNLKLDGSYHALKVTLKNAREATWQARRGYFAPKHVLDAAEQAKEEIREAVFSREEMVDIPLDVQTQFFKSSDVNAKLAVLAKVDVKRLRFRKADGRNNDTLTVVSGLFDRNGNLITAMQKLVEMHLKDETLANRLGSGITLKTNFDVTPGSYVIRVVIRDQEGELMAARNGVVEIP